MRAVVFVGGEVRLEERPDPEPGSQDVVVGVHFAGVNPVDLAQRAGRFASLAPVDDRRPYGRGPGSLPYPTDVPGVEVAGVVESCGTHVTCWLPGDRVFGLVGGGGLADRVVAHERLLAAVPDGLDEQQAAAVPEVFVTAHDALRQAELRPGEVALVHGAAGGVGHASLQIVRMWGARALGVTRSGADVVRQLGGEPVADEGFAAATLQLTGGRGADVIVEIAGAAHFPGNIEALALKGRIVLVGATGADAPPIPLTELIRRHGVLRGVSLRFRPLEQKAAAVAAFDREVVPGLADGRLVALVDSVFPAERAAEAFDRVAAAGKRGRVLVEF